MVVRTGSVELEVTDLGATLLRARAAIVGVAMVMAFRVPVVPARRKAIHS
mgnify:CR=1 FL=1